MHIDQNKIVSGVSEQKISSFLRENMDCEWGLEDLANDLNIGLDTAESIVLVLQARGLVVQPRALEDVDLWHTTIEGNRFAQAKIGRSITHRTAENLIAAFIERVKEVNNDPYYLFVINKVYVFGSYLSSSARINDIDLIIDLKPREIDPEKHPSLCQERSHAAVKAGECPRNDIYKILAWPQTEIYRYLRSRSRSYEFHPMDDLPLARNSGTYKVIFDLEANL